MCVSVCVLVFVYVRSMEHKFQSVASLTVLACGGCAHWSEILFDNSSPTAPHTPNQARHFGHNRRIGGLGTWCRTTRRTSVINTRCTPQTFEVHNVPCTATYAHSGGSIVGSGDGVKSVRERDESSVAALHALTRVFVCEFHLNQINFSIMHAR